MKILGVGFSAYYNPQFQVSFLCNFFNAAIGNITTYGVVVYNPVASFLFYHVECPIPMISMAVTVVVSLFKSTGAVYLFGGFSNANLITVLYNWTSASTNVNTSVIGLGFSLFTMYHCYFYGFSHANKLPYNTSFTGLATSLTLLNCGPVLGFNSTLGIGNVTLAIFEVSSNGTDTYRVPAIGATSISYNLCINTVQDGFETGIMKKDIV